MGTPAEIVHMGSLLRIPSVSLHEDDAAVIPLYCKYSHPWSTHILSPRVCDNGKWEKKSIKYESYHELAYLHPGHFKASKEIVRKYLDPVQPYFLIRFSKLSAHHDTGIRGISDELALKIIAMLTPHGRIFITSERPLSEQFESFRLNIDPMEIHHVMAFAQVYVGDSQTMAAEAGVLGVPFLRFNDFVGRIGYLKELEETYELGYGIRPSEPELLFERLRKLLEMKDRPVVFQNRRAKMLEDKIDLSQFMVWFFENYPKSVQTMRENPDYQYNFR
jgi:predicted glycosyltransferase